MDYPTKLVRVIDSFGAGGGPEMMARALSQKLSELWGKPVTVENHPGAGSTVGPALAAKSPPDGYTLLINTSAHTYSAALSKDLAYDPLKDFVPVASLTTQGYVLVAGNPAGVSTVGELISAAKAKPGEQVRFRWHWDQHALGSHEIQPGKGIRAMHAPARPMRSPTPSRLRPPGVVLT